jgi:hypothetical protein
VDAGGRDARRPRLAPAASDRSCRLRRHSEFRAAPDERGIGYIAQVKGDVPANIPDVMPARWTDGTERRSIAIDALLRVKLDLLTDMNCSVGGRVPARRLQAVPCRYRDGGPPQAFTWRVS